MAGPVKKFFGSLSLDGLGKAVRGLPNKVDESEKWGKQLKVTAAQWEDGGISIGIWDPEKKEEIKLGNLRVSQFEFGGGAESSDSFKPKEEDLPF